MGLELPFLKRGSKVAHSRNKVPRIRQNNPYVPHPHYFDLSNFCLRHTYLRLTSIDYFSRDEFHFFAPMSMDKSGSGFQTLSLFAGHVVQLVACFSVFGTLPSMVTLYSG